jgi:hypothetical protein
MKNGGVSKYKKLLKVGILIAILVLGVLLIDALNKNISEYSLIK